MADADRAHQGARGNRGHTKGEHPPDPCSNEQQTEQSADDFQGLCGRGYARAPYRAIEIRYLSKYSKQTPLRQVSFAPILRKPSIDEWLADIDMPALPPLVDLTHRQKDLLISTLWKKISMLRQQKP